MKDPRMKILAVIALSFASFMSGIAALFTVLWWIVHDRKKGSVLRSRPFWIYLGIILLFSLLVQIEGENGALYLIRFGAIALVAVWTYHEYHPGEFLDVAVWTFGKRWGFELGLMAEMSMQGLRILREDVDRIRLLSCCFCLPRCAVRIPRPSSSPSADTGGVGSSAHSFRGRPPISCLPLQPFLSFLCRYFSSTSGKSGNSPMVPVARRVTVIRGKNLTPKGIPS
jgi:hypothetical protein